MKCCSILEVNLAKRLKGWLYGLAPLIDRQLKDGIFMLCRDRNTYYGFVSSIDGVLINDVVGDKSRNHAGTKLSLV
ncbi:MAG: hypothetical protein ACTS85_03450 [Arsenophonus sp. NC-PG7-MAG3]